MTALALRRQIGGEWVERADGWWLETEPGRIRHIGATCLAAGARLSAIVGCPASSRGVTLSWHWDLGGTLLSVRAVFDEGRDVPSFADLCAAADWAEREARDYFAVSFEGRGATAPLMLREGDAPGILLDREGGAR